MYVDFHATFSSDFCGFEWIWGVTKVPGIGPTRGAALLRLGVSIWTSSDGFRIFSKILRSFLTKFSSGATMISSALSRPRRPQGTQGTRSMAPKTCDFCRQEGSLDVPGITSKLQQNIVQCPPSCSRVHIQWFQERSSDVILSLIREKIIVLSSCASRAWKASLQREDDIWWCLMYVQMDEKMMNTNKDKC